MIENEQKSDLQFLLYFGAERQIRKKKYDKMEGKTTT